MASTPSTTATTATSTTPLDQILMFFGALTPYIKSGFSLAYTVLKTTLELLRRNVMIPIPALAYLFAPLTVFLSYLAVIFIISPWSTLVYLLDVLHPLYVFFGVACLTGMLLGLLARYLAGVLIVTLDPPPNSMKPRKSRGPEVKLEIKT